MAGKIDKFVLLKGISLGIELAAPVILLALLGRLVDKQFGTFPGGMVIGVVVGAIVGFWNVVKFVIDNK